MCGYLGIKFTNKAQVCFCSNCKSRWIWGTYFHWMKVDSFSLPLSTTLIFSTAGLQIAYGERTDDQDLAMEWIW